MKPLAVVSILAGILLTGCVTPYGRNGLLGGYDDKQIAQDVFRVSFIGNGYTSKQDMVSMLMRRASEVTQAQGYAYFSIVSEATKWSGGFFSKPTPQEYRTYTPSETAALQGGQGIGLTPIFIPEGMPWCAILIKCYHTQPKGNNSYNAESILANVHSGLQ